MLLLWDIVLCILQAASQFIINWIYVIGNNMCCFKDYSIILQRYVQYYLHLIIILMDELVTTWVQNSHLLSIWVDIGMRDGSPTVGVWNPCHRGRGGCTSSHPTYHYCHQTHTAAESSPNEYMSWHGNRDGSPTVGV